MGYQIGDRVIHKETSRRGVVEECARLNFYWILFDADEKGSKESEFCTIEKLEPDYKYNLLMVAEN